MTDGTGFKHHPDRHGEYTASPDVLPPRIKQRLGEHGIDASDTILCIPGLSGAPHIRNRRQLLHGTTVAKALTDFRCQKTSTDKPESSQYSSSDLLYDLSNNGIKVVATETAVAVGEKGWNRSMEDSGPDNSDPNDLLLLATVCERYGQSDPVGRNNLS